MDAVDPARYLLYAAVILVASGAAVGVAWGLSPMSTWVRRVVALVAAGAVALFAVLEVESSFGISALVVVASGAIAAVFARTVTLDDYPRELPQVIGADVEEVEVEPEPLDEIVLRLVERSE